MMQEFLKWLFFQRARQDPVGTLARDAFMDVDWNCKLKSLEEQTRGTYAEDVFHDTVTEFRTQRKKY